MEPVEPVEFPAAVTDDAPVDEPTGAPLPAFVVEPRAERALAWERAGASVPTSRLPPAPVQLRASFVAALARHGERIERPIVICSSPVRELVQDALADVCGEVLVAGYDDMQPHAAIDWLEVLDLPLGAAPLPWAEPPGATGGHVDPDVDMGDAVDWRW